MKKVLATILALVMALSVTTISWATLSTLPSAVDGVIKLTENATIDTLQDGMTYDLNGYTLTYVGGTHQVAEGKTLTFKDSSVTGNARGGTLELTGVTGTTAAINPQKNSTLKVSNITVTCTGSAFFPQGNAAEVDVIACDVTASIYCVGTNASNAENGGVVITLKDSAFVANAADGDNCPVMINVPGTLDIDNCTITGDRQAVLVRAGTATITNSDIKTTGKYAKAASQYHEEAWKSGNEVPAAALTVGNYQNKAATAYLADAKVTVTNTKLTAESGVPAIYTDANDTYKGDLTIGGDSTVVAGDVMKGQNAEKAAVAVTGGSYDSNVTGLTTEAVAVTGESEGTYVVGQSGINAVAKAGNNVRIVKGNVTLTDVPAGVIVYPEEGTVVVNGKDISGRQYSDGYTVPQPPRYYYNSTTTTTTGTKADGTKGSPKTFDAGVGIYAVSAILSVTGMAYVGKKKF